MFRGIRSVLSSVFYHQRDGMFMRRVFSSNPSQREMTWIDAVGGSLQFSCTQCGKCCKGKTLVFINYSEAMTLANYLGYPDVHQFIKEKTKTVEKKKCVLIGIIR